jgi:hypothetical protein
MPFDDLGFARLDTHRSLRKLVPEVVFCQGKTIEQSQKIILRLVSRHGRVLATRAPAELASRFAATDVPGVPRVISDGGIRDGLKGRRVRARYDPLSRVLTVFTDPPCGRGRGLVGVLCAGTGDIPVAEEAARTAEFVGAGVERSYDVGVAGLHRLAAARGAMDRADAIVVAAGMEGALPSVVGGLVGVPVIAVPTSVGYGASFRGLAALLAMINSCSPGIAVVNIDNGFGAGYIAAMIAVRSGKRRGRRT